MRTKERKPTTPGEILREEFLHPMGITQSELAKHINCDVKVINRIVNDASGISAEMAIKLGAALNTTPHFWMNLQNAISLHQASEQVGRLPPVHAKVRAANS